MELKGTRFKDYLVFNAPVAPSEKGLFRARSLSRTSHRNKLVLLKHLPIENQEAFDSRLEQAIKPLIGSVPHPNIAQIFECDRNEGGYYVVEEYVSGRNLAQCRGRLQQMNIMFALDMSCYIMSKVCHAVSFAHSIRMNIGSADPGVTHFNISPKKILIGYDGKVKLSGFEIGLQRQSFQPVIDKTGAHPSTYTNYLSPEQVVGEPADFRADVFSLGVILWELFTARGLFVTYTPMEMRALMATYEVVAPSQFNSAVPPVLDQIVVRCLHPNPNMRYQNVADLHNDLTQALHQLNPKFNAADLGFYTERSFKEEMAWENKVLLDCLQYEENEAA